MFKKLISSLHLRRVAGLFMLAALTACDTNSNTTSKVEKPAAASAPEQASTKKVVLFFGDSLTAGYGLDDPGDAYPADVQKKIDSLKLPYTVINAGVSGETSAGGKSRIDWTLKQKVDVFVLELGANDGLRGTPVSTTISNLQTIIDKVKAKYPDARLVLAGMMVPPSMGAAYAGDFKNIFPELAAKNEMTLIPFLLQNVAGNPRLNQADGIHPTAEGARIVADNVWAVLKDVL